MGKRGKYLEAGAGGAGDGGLLLVLVLVGALCRRGLGREEPLASLARHRRRREALDLDRVRGVVRCKGRRVVLFKLTVACEERVICADLSMTRGGSFRVQNLNLVGGALSHGVFAGGNFWRCEISSGLGHATASV